MDLHSRRVLGWSVSEKNDAPLVCQALENAQCTRGELRRGIIHHSDRGSTYACDAYQGLQNRLGMTSSMSAKGNCYDNAAMESFFGRFKTSTIRDRELAGEAELRAVVFEYIEPFYNRYRKHSSLGYRSPVEFEEMISPSAPAGHVRQVKLKPPIFPSSSYAFACHSSSSARGPHGSCVLRSHPLKGRGVRGGGSPDCGRDNS